MYVVSAKLFDLGKDMTYLSSSRVAVIVRIDM